MNQGHCTIIVIAANVSKPFVVPEQILQSQLIYCYYVILAILVKFLLCFAITGTKVRLSVNKVQLD